MAKKFIQRFLPDQDYIKAHPSLRILGNWVHDANLWHLNRHSVSSAFFIGLFWCFIPVPSQMIMAGLSAMLLRANLPLSVALVWITNPLTMAPVFYFAYRVGVAITGSNYQGFAFELSWTWFSQGLADTWQPFLIGSVACGLFFGLLGSTTVRYLWRWHAVRRWHQRRLQRQQR